MSDHPRVRPGWRGRRQAGLTLVELMIGLMLGLVIVAALGQLYAGGKATTQVGQGLANLNENGRFAVDLLSADLRIAGYLSCGGAGADIGNTLNDPTHWLRQTTGLLGFEGGKDTPPSELWPEVRADTDVLIVRHAAAAGATTGDTLQPGEVLMISNRVCNQATLFQLTKPLTYNPNTPFAAATFVATTGSEPGNCTNKLFGGFDCGATSGAYAAGFGLGYALSPFEVHAYYISASDPPSLMRMRLCRQAGKATTCVDELVRDVENFQVEYCCDAGSYIPADQVVAKSIDWDDLTSVRFALLLRSRDANAKTKASAESINLLGTTLTTPNDRRLRRVFGGVVALRNQLQ